jgi:hypothetical protein
LEHSRNFRSFGFEKLWRLYFDEWFWLLLTTHQQKTTWNHCTKPSKSSWGYWRFSFNTSVSVYDLCVIVYKIISRTHLRAVVICISSAATIYPVLSILEYEFSKGIISVLWFNYQCRMKEWWNLNLNKVYNNLVFWSFGIFIILTIEIYLPLKSIQLIFLLKFLFLL